MKPEWKVRREKEILSKVRCAIICIALLIFNIVLFVGLSQVNAERKENIPTETITESATDIIQWKDTEVGIESTTEIVVGEPLENETEMATKVDEVVFFDVPLSEEIQLHIFAECEKHAIAPAMIIAIIERESSFRAHIIGDNGASFGYMQWQPKYQKERMERLGCTDPLDPYQNITVGIDIIAEYIEKYEDVALVLMAYNGGEPYMFRMRNAGKISKYALEVPERAAELEAQTYGE